jgi:hypothetical protein
MSSLSALVAVACVLASLRRLAVAVAPTSLDTEALRQGLAGLGAVRRFGAAIGADAAFEWERGLFAALAEPDPRLRGALVDEQLTELYLLATGWSRVPRICASIATSTGFLLASVSLLRSLSAPQTLTIGSALTPAVDAFALGLMAAAFCVAIHSRAARAERESLAAIHRLVDGMQWLSGGPENDHPHFSRVAASCSIGGK